jgi:hypothetical protein
MTSLKSVHINSTKIFKTQFVEFVKCHDELSTADEPISLTYQIFIGMHPHLQCVRKILNKICSAFILLTRMMRHEIKF